MKEQTEDKPQEIARPRGSALNELLAGLRCSNTKCEHHDTMPKDNCLGRNDIAECEDFTHSPKDYFKVNALYYTQNPRDYSEIVLAKAVNNDFGKCLHFFSSDCEGFIRWHKVEIAYRVETKIFGS